MGSAQILFSPQKPLRNWEATSVLNQNVLTKNACKKNLEGVKIVYRNPGGFASIFHQCYCQWLIELYNFSLVYFPIGHYFGWGTAWGCFSYRLMRLFCYPNLIRQRQIATSHYISSPSPQSAEFSQKHRRRKWDFNQRTTETNLSNVAEEYSRQFYNKLLAERPNLCRNA